MIKRMIPVVSLLALAGQALAQTPPPAAGAGGQQMPSAETRFAQYDSNKDGKLSLDEYKAGRAGMMQGMRQGQGQGGGQGQPQGQGGRQGGMMQGMGTPEERFKALDTNKDGALSLDEYKAGRGAGMGPGMRRGQGPDSGNANRT